MLKAATLVLVCHLMDNGVTRWCPQILASEWDPAIPEWSLGGRGATKAQFIFVALRAGSWQL